MDLISFLRDWENLSGAVIGGVFSLVVALIVARSARRADEHAAAMIVISNLVQFLTRVRILEKMAKEQKVPEQDYGKWASEKLTYSRPKLSGTFEGSVARLLRLHVSVAAHLELFYMLARDIDERIDRISEDFKEFHAHGKPRRPSEVMEADANLIASSLSDAALHADLAEYMLTKLVLGSYPTFYRIRRAIFPSEKDKQSVRALLRSNP